VLTPGQAVEQVANLRGMSIAERGQLNVVRRYWQGAQNLPILIPQDAPREMRVLARIARVNVCKIVVDSLAQSLFVDGFRDSPTTPTNAAESVLWKTWQANKMDTRQSGLHRAAAAYGASYAVVLPGDPYPVIRPVSPRKMTAFYTDDDQDWPLLALERRAGGMWKLYDADAIYTVGRANGVKSNSDALEFIRSEIHDAGVTPVVRYLDEYDLDADDDVELDQRIFWDGLKVPMRGQVAPLMSLQDQIDVTTFGLLVAQWWGAFRQRYVIGWTAPSENALIKASMARLMTFEDPPAETGGEGGIKVGEFQQTQLDGYISSRDASLTHAATLSQTPVHELVGKLVNLSAEALAAAEQGHERKVGERKTSFGESHEQMLWLAGKYQDVKVELDAEVVWRDTSARSFAAIVDGLGKLAQMLNVPAEELWLKIPGVTQQDVERWKATAAQGDSFDKLSQLLDRQTKPNAA
jgi:hypothetical protein